MTNTCAIFNLLQNNASYSNTKYYVGPGRFVTIISNYTSQIKRVWIFWISDVGYPKFMLLLTLPNFFIPATLYLPDPNCLPRSQDQNFLYIMNTPSAFIREFAVTDVKGHIINYGREGTDMLGKIRPWYSVIPPSNQQENRRSPHVKVPWFRDPPITAGPN